jgi:hypothetical protein
MINLLVDEGYAFDYLSILYIKQNLYPDNLKKQTYNQCYEYLMSQIENFETIISSSEYKALLQSNAYTFTLIDKLRNNESITAKEIDDSNMDRYHRKVDLQKRFFPQSTVTETKIV